MFKNYLTIALRNIIRQKGYSIINLVGLAIGMAATMLILLFVQFEMSYDKYHDQSDRIYRLSREWLNQDGETNLHLGHLAPPFAPLMENDFEGVIDEAVRVLSGGSPVLGVGGNNLVEDGFFFFDPNVFEIFSWKFVTGDPETALAEPNTVVLTQRAAQKYFGDIDPVGEQIVYKNFGMEVEMKVTGLIENIPPNSHFEFDVMGSMLTVEAIFGRDNMMQNFGSNNYSTYILFPDESSIEEFKNGLPGFIDKHLASSDPEAPKASTRNIINMMPVTDVHLRSNLDSEIGSNGDIEIIYIITIIALLILLIACINFMNLSTARSSKRAREVGMRKVMGAQKSLLVRQFLIESTLFSLISFIVALIMVYITLPYFAGFVDKPLNLNVFTNPMVILISLLIVIVVGILAGSYPSFYLSSFKPASILKGGHKSVGRKFNLRSALVIFQFCISAGLIIAIGVVQDQLDYVKSKDLGFNKENILVLPAPADLFPKFESVKTKLEAHPSINEVGLSSRVPSGRLLDSQGASAEVKGEMQQINFRIADVHIDFSYLPQLEVPLAAGRHFNPDIASDSTEAFIINESAVETIGWDSPEDAIDKSFNYGNRQGRIIGVVKDFHFESLHQPIAPIVFLITSNRFSSVLVKVKPGGVEDAEDFLREEWSFLRPDFPYSSYLLNENFDQQYAEEDRLSQVISSFGFLAIIIAALGLFGLASYVTEQRVKEIGIRKVMGASVPSILLLLTRGFTLLVLIGFLISIPIAWYFMDKWLSGFAYATSINIGSIILAGFITIFIAWVTVSFRTIRAAQNNPVNSLRYE